MLELKLTESGQVDHADRLIITWDRRPLWWQKQGLQQTASGYGKKLCTQWVVLIGTRWHRIYCAQFSNVGTCYIIRQGKRWVVAESFPTVGKVTPRTKG